MSVSRVSDPYRLLYQLEAREIGISMVRKSYPKFEKRDDSESEENSEEEHQMRFPFPFRDHFDSDDEDDDEDDSDDSDVDVQELLDEEFVAEQRAILDTLRISSDDIPSLEEISSSSEESIDINQPPIPEFCDLAEASEEENQNSSLMGLSTGGSFSIEEEEIIGEEENKEEKQENDNLPLFTSPIILDGQDQISDVIEEREMLEEPSIIVQPTNATRNEEKTKIDSAKDAELHSAEYDSCDESLPDLEDFDNESDSSDLPARKKAKFSHSQEINQDSTTLLSDDLPDLEDMSESSQNNTPSLPDDLLALIRCNSDSSDLESYSIPITTQSHDSDLPELLSSHSDSEELETTSNISNILEKRSRGEMQRTNEAKESEIEPPESVPHGKFQFQYTHHTFSPYSFRQQSSAHHFFVKRMKHHKKLVAHTGCVNTINWSTDGNFLISGGDDTTVAIWDYDSGSRCRQRIHTGHAANIFSVKFLPNGLNDYIITCARDGKVLAFNIEHGELQPEEEAIRPITGIPLLDCSCHRSEVKRLTVDNENPMVFQSCGADGNVFLFDIREPHTCRAADSMKYLVRDASQEFFSMDANPLRPYEFVVAGTSRFLSLFDKRVPEKQFGAYGANGRRSHITGVAYNYLGTELIGSYSSGGIYLFGTDDMYQCKHELEHSWENEIQTYTQLYTGHKNTDTVKSVNFFGPQSEYIVSGSDCGRIFLWDKWTSEVVNFFPADRNIVNCITGHPTDHNVLASSGIENHVHLWSPTGTEEANLENLENIVHENTTNRLTGGNAGDIFRRLMLAQFLRNNDLEDLQTDSDEEGPPDRCTVM